MPIDDASYSKLQGTDYKCAESPASETLSDIEDLEVCNLVTILCSSVIVAYSLSAM